MFGESHQKSTPASVENDINDVYVFLKNVGVILCADTSSELSDNTFWEHVIPRTRKKGTPRHNANEKVNITEHERRALDIFMNKPAIEYKDREVLGGDNGTDDVIVSDDVSVATNNSNDSYRVVEDNEEEVFDPEVQDMTMMIGSDLVANANDAVANVDTNFDVIVVEVLQEKLTTI